MQRHQIIAQLRSQDGYQIKPLCRVLEVSRSGFYDAGKKAQRLRRQQDGLLIERLAELFFQSRHTYGCLRLQHALRQQQIRCGKNRIARLMKQCQLRPRQKRRFRPKTTQSKQGRPVAPNRLLELSPVVEKPDQVWVADLTYLPAQGGQKWFYLALEMDLYSRLIVGWKVGLSLQSGLIEEAFTQAVVRYGLAPEIHHSDRGVQYASESFQNLLAAYQVSPSMSRRANCYDNAAMESFLATLKAECFGHHWPADLKEATTMLFDYIETFYNTRRIHSSLGFLTPTQFEKQFQPSIVPLKTT